MATAIKIFCCYARDDQPLVQRLKKHLMLLQRQGLIQIWSDTDIDAGDAWEQAINQHLETAEIILLLISSDFIASEYCYSKEMQRAMQRHDQQVARVIPILLRPTYWNGAPFEKLQMLPTNAKPVTDRSWTEDEALYDVVEQLGTVVKTLRLKNTLDEINKLVADHHPEEALILCEQVITLEPQHGPTLRQKGEILFVLGRYQESLDALNQVQQFAPQIIDTEFHRKQAQTLEHLQQYEEALTAYDQALQLHPRNIHVLQEKAALLQKLQRLQEALSTYEKLTQLDTTNAFYYQTRGNIYLLLQRPQEALAAYKQALQYNPDNVDVYKKQGEVLLKLQHYKEAQSTFEQAIRIAPQDASLHFTLGKSLLSLDCYKEALAAFQTSIGQDPHNPYCYHGKGLALFALEEYKAALDALDQALHLAPSPVDPQFYRDQARLYEQLAQQAYQQEQAAKREWKSSSEPDFFVNAITIENLQNITTLHTLTGHTEEVWGIAFSPDGYLLASGSLDNTIRLWDL